jgi:hypothetical protein
MRVEGGSFQKGAIMARFDYLSPYIENTPEYLHLLDPTLRFIDYLMAESGESSYCFVSTRFGRDVVEEQVAPTCWLDFLLVWLAEGDACESVSTFEDWLLTIIAILDQVNRGEFGARLSLRYGYNFGRRPSEFNPDYATEGSVMHVLLDESQIGGLTQGPKFDKRLPYLAAELDLGHPALDRQVFARCHQRYERNLTELALGRFPRASTT